jgi:Fur family zinc uptake transcriptional regulator
MTPECAKPGGDADDMEALLSRAEQLCDARAQRFTPLRRQIYGVIAGASGPISAYQILARILDTGRESGPPTVYRALEFLQAQHLIHRVESMNAFVVCRRPEEHHTCQLLICTACGDTSELEAGGLLTAMARTAAAVGFTISDAVLELKGLCLRCSASLSSLLPAAARRP